MKGCHYYRIEPDAMRRSRSVKEMNNQRLTPEDPLQNWLYIFLDKVLLELTDDRGLVRVRSISPDGYSTQNDEYPNWVG